MPGIVWGARDGSVTLANSYGSGFAEHPLLRPYLPAAAMHLCGTTLTLPALADGTELATSPVFDGSGTPSLVGRPAVVRMQVARTGDEYAVMRGGAARVLAPGDHPSHPTAQIVKDAAANPSERKRLAVPSGSRSHKAPRRHPGS